MDIIKIFKNAYKQYYCQGENSLYQEKNGFSILYSGINSIYHNYVFIDNIFKDIPLDLNFDAGVFSFLHNKEFVQNISNNISLFGSGGIVIKNTKDNYQPLINNNIKIKSLQNNKNLLDEYILLVSLIRNIGKNNLYEIFNNNTMNENNHIYLAYIDNKAIGFLGATIVDDYAFATESFVLDQYRNAGVLTALAEQAMFDGLEKNIYKYLCLISSQYSLKVAQKQGYKYQMPCNLWKYDSMI